MNNKNFIKIEDTTIETESFITEEQRIILLSKFRLLFQDKFNSGILDTMFYNFLRKKPLFNGVNKIRFDKYYMIKYCSKSTSNSFYLSNYLNYSSQNWYLKLINDFCNTTHHAHYLHDKTKIHEIIECLFITTIINFKEV